MYNKNRPKRLRPKLLGSEHILGRTGERSKRLENCESCLSCMFIRPCFEISVLYRNVVIWLRTTVKIYIKKKKKHSWQLSMTCSCVHGFQQVQQIHYTDLQFQHPLSFENIGPIIFRHFNWFTLCLWEEQDCNRNKQNVKHFSWFVCSRFLSYCNGFRLKGTTIPI